MDQVSALRSVLDVRWDAPYRFIASLAALVTIAGVFHSQKPLATFAAVASWAGLNEAVMTLGATASWVSERPIVLIASGVLLLTVGAIFAFRQGRGASTALVGSTLLVQVGGGWNLLPLVVIGAMLLVWLLARLFAHLIFDIIDDPTHYLGSSIVAMICALFWVVLGPLSWMVRSG